MYTRGIEDSGTVEANSGRKRTKRTKRKRIRRSRSRRQVEDERESA